MFGKRKKAAVDEEQRFALVVRLRDVSFFGGFSPSELERVADMAEEVEVTPGAVLIEQGRVGQECYVIIDGEASVVVGDEPVATIGPGSMVGEMALVEHRPRNASVIADTPMLLVAFDTKAFKTMLTEMPKVHERVMETLGARLRSNAARPDADG
ncbi:MAG: cyclic nucleotide-binding domain-containing protein [Acidimicrobiia bacterium]|nr:cyclic nucleotide-binding domain-containing protein [Acidimicrobiia bacterium]